MVTFQHMPEILSNPRLYREYPQAACDLLEQIMWIGASPKEKMSSAALRMVRAQFLKPAVIGDLLRMSKI